MLFQDYEKEFIRLLNENNVRCLLVGGQAVSYHGSDDSERQPNDTDFFYERNLQNANNLIRCVNSYLHERDFDKKALDPNELVDKVKTLGIAPPKLETIDLLNHLEGVNFGEAWNNREVATDEDDPSLELSVIGRIDLIKNKEALVKNMSKELEKHKEDINILTSSAPDC